MPLTPLHVFPAISVYLLFYRRLNGLALLLGTTLLSDLEPILYEFTWINYPRVLLLFGGFARQGPHVITHNPFSIILLVAPATMLLTKLLELAGRGTLMELLPGAEWISYSWIATYFSALLGSFLHLSWDLTMHVDVNLGFPFIYVPNPFINYQASIVILQASLVMIPVAYVIGRRINSGSPFKKLP